MLDNQLIELFLPIITQSLTTSGYTGVSVKQFNQPTQQGINTNATLYFQKISDRRYGWPFRSDVWNLDTQAMNHAEVQLYQTTFQISALVTQDPANISYTASDLLNEVAAILQSDDCISVITPQQVGILRVTDITNIFFVDDRDQFEAHPSFDFTLTHKQTRVTAGQVITLPIGLNIQRV